MKYFILNSLSRLFMFGTMAVAAWAQTLPGPDQRAIEAFLASGGYLSWANQPAHLSGTLVGDINYAVHGYIHVYYSDGVDGWINASPLPKPTGGLANDEMIVALEYQPPPTNPGTPGPLQRIYSMVRHDGGSKGGSYDGWFWSVTDINNGNMVNSAESYGDYGLSECTSCHAGANNDSLVYLNKDGPISATGWTPDAELAAKTTPPPTRALRQPLGAASQTFLSYYGVADVAEVGDLAFPPKVYDHVWPGYYAGMSGKEREKYITSDQCRGCHDANRLLSNSTPNMWYADPDPATNLPNGANTPDSTVARNFSPYGEWSASLNGLAGRDPVWHAQVDFERKLRPGFEDFTTSTCFSCHGPMAGRQLAEDKGPNNLFTEDMFYSIPPNANHVYGALARDGVSCAVCHQIPSEELGVDPEFLPREPSGYYLPRDLKSYTAMFADPPDEGAKYWGPFPDSEVLSVPMDRALGSRAAHGPIGPDGKPQIRESKLCGTCHTVLVPALPVGYTLPQGIDSPFDDPNMKLSFEQTTYFEWRNSLFENEVNTASTTAITCQGCHMPAHLDQRIVNAESDRFPPVSGRNLGQNNFAKHASVGRHVLLGINYFVFEMYEQFPQLTGALPPTGKVPAETVEPLLNARDWIENHAKTITADVRVTALSEDGTNLNATVEVTNLAGHKLPTGAGFRRAYLRFEVLDGSGAVLWASGRTTELGVLVGADGITPLASEETIQPEMSQPHHQIITSQDQVQIYETRALNSNQELQTTVLGIYYEYKDNRIPPLGYQPVEEGDIPSRGATAAVLVGDPANQPSGVETVPPPGVPHEATVHPTIPDGATTSPFTVVYDPDYWLAAQTGNGQDHIGYRIPLNQITGWAMVRVQLFYQTIPPYYLRDRFETGKDPGEQLPKERDMNRLIHMASRLNLDGTPGENWSLAIGEPVEVALGGTSPSLTQAEAWEKIKNHYKYLNLSSKAKESKKTKRKKSRRKK